MPLGKPLRLRRLNSKGRTVVAALDRGSVAGAVRGLENPASLVTACAGAGADGILVTPGLLDLAGENVGQLAILLRLDGGATTAGAGGPMRLMTDVEQAVAEGADAVVVSATVGSAYEGLELEKLGRVASAARRWGMPVVADVLSERMLASQTDDPGRGSDPLPADFAADVALCCRIGIELGADVIKTRYPGEPETFRRIVAATGRPILVAGGPLRNPDLETTLLLVEEILAAGAVGVVFGRQIWQQADPGAALRAICAMVREDATVAEALEFAGV